LSRLHDVYKNHHTEGSGSRLGARGTSLAS
jgi:multisubunit Na+/H+ antiporter MnhG subunit